MLVVNWWDDRCFDELLLTGEMGESLVNRIESKLFSVKFEVILGWISLVLQFFTHRNVIYVKINKRVAIVVMEHMGL